MNPATGCVRPPGAPYTVVDVSENAAALAYVQDLGYSQAPVVVISDHEHWSGFRPDLLANLAPSDC